jgi:very-short-patch-repair endonuclease
VVEPGAGWLARGRIGFGQFVRYRLILSRTSVVSFPETAISQSAVAGIVLGATPGKVLVLAGPDGALLRRLIDQAEPQPNFPRALFAQISRAQTAEAAMHQLADQLADLARLLWPMWFTDVSFAECGTDVLGRLARSAIMRRAAARMNRLQTAWAELAIDQVQQGRPPRIKGMVAAAEIAQLTLAIHRHGLVIVIDVETACANCNAAAVVHALETVAQVAQCGVVALFRTIPAHQPPFDRILYGARVLAMRNEQAEDDGWLAGTDEAVWLAPWLGSSHPLSDTEQRLERALRADRELAPLFGCNQIVETAHGARPRVDFVWTRGRMVVELDGYGSHGNRAAFMYDRHRDYELTLSGYTVLRLANDEIAQDVGKAIEKIRDIVRVCRNRIT